MCHSVFLFVYQFIWLFNIFLKTHLCSVKLVCPYVHPSLFLSVCIVMSEYVFLCICSSVYLSFLYFTQNTFVLSKTFQMSSCMPVYLCLCLTFFLLFYLFMILFTISLETNICPVKLSVSQFVC
jgi:hypothetical protein